MRPAAPNKKRTKKLHKKWSFFYCGRSEPSGIPKDAASLGWSCVASVANSSPPSMFLLCKNRGGPPARVHPAREGQDEPRKAVRREGVQNVAQRTFAG